MNEKPIRKFGAVFFLSALFTYVPIARGDFVVYTTFGSAGVTSDIIGSYPGGATNREVANPFALSQMYQITAYVVNVKQITAQTGFLRLWSGNPTPSTMIESISFNLPSVGSGFANVRVNSILNPITEPGSKYWFSLSVPNIPTDQCYAWMWSNLPNLERYDRTPGLAWQHATIGNLFSVRGNPVPEPTTLLLFFTACVGDIALATWRRRK